MKKSLGVKAGKSLPTLNLRLRQQAEKWIFWKDAMEDISLVSDMCGAFMDLLVFKRVGV